eukprot:UN5020
MDFSSQAHQHFPHTSSRSKRWRHARLLNLLQARAVNHQVNRNDYQWHCVVTAASRSRNCAPSDTCLQRAHWITRRWHPALPDAHLQHAGFTECRGILHCSEDLQQPGLAKRRDNSALLDAQHPRTQLIDQTRASTRQTNAYRKYACVHTRTRARTHENGALALRGKKRTLATRRLDASAGIGKHAWNKHVAR